MYTGNSWFRASFKEEGDRLMNKPSKAKDPLGRGRGCSSYMYTMLSAAGVLSFLFLWQIALEAGLLSDRYVSRPTELIFLFFQKFSDTTPDGSTLPVAILASLKVSLTGLIVAIFTGIPLGMLMGWYKGIDKFVRPLFEVLRPIPPISWIPLTIVWLGIGLKAKAFIIFFAAFIPCVINSYTGIKLTSKTLINVAKTFGASNFTTFIRVGIPSAMPMAFAGIRVALGNAWSTLVAAEMLAATAGLGYMILMGRSFARPDIIMLGMIVIGALGALFTGVLNFFEKKVIKWRAAK